MAIASFKKVELFGHNIAKDGIISELHEQGLLEIRDLTEVSAKEAPVRIDCSELKSHLDEIEHAITFLEQFEEKKGLAEGLIQKKPLMNSQQLTQLMDDFDSSTFCLNLKKFEHELHELNNLDHYYHAQIELLTPWKTMTIPLEATHETKCTNITLGTVPDHDIESLVEDLKPFLMHIDIVNQHKNHTYLFMIYLKTDHEKISSLLKTHNFNYTDFPEKNETVITILENSQKEIENIKKTKTELIEKIKKQIPNKIKLSASYDHTNIQLQRRSIQNSFGTTQSAFYFQGWILGEQVSNFKQQLLEKHTTIDVFISDPQEDETPPVLLDNPTVFKPYEIITEMYGMPHHAQVDPTPYLAPFFFIFFGLCLTDAGYGLIILLFGLFMIKKMNLGNAGKRFMKLVASLGLATFILGALMGGWFGNALEFLPKQLSFITSFTKTITILDPLGNPDDSLKFILLSLFLGIVHVLLGMSINFVNHILKKKKAQAYLVDLPWILLIITLLPLLSAYIFNMAIPGAILFISKNIALLSVGSILFFTGGVKGNIFIRLIQGGYALYGITGYLADIMSYFRLFALGLATGGIALAINSIVKIVAGIPYLGPILAILLFIAGHTYNLLINLLGAFVHTCRLQFLEFFMKFFEGGGRAFKPFKIDTKYVTLKSEK